MLSRSCCAAPANPDLEHASCVESSRPPEHPCGACGMPLEKSLDSSEIGNAIQKQIMAMPGLGHLNGLALKRQIGSPSSQVTTTSAEKITAKATQIPNTLPDVPACTESSTNRQPFLREPASLQITETDLAEIVSQVSKQYPPETAQQRPQMSSDRVGEVRRTASETRLDMGVLKTTGQDSTSNSALPSLKTDKNAVRKGKSKSVRKALKAGNRRWIDLRKALLANKREVVIAVLFVFCVCLLGFLMSGEDEETPAAVKPIVEEMDLPHVRINPALRGQRRGRGKTHGGNRGRVLRRKSDRFLLSPVHQREKRALVDSEDWE